MLKDLVLKNRSVRRFQEKKKIGRKTLEELIDFARITPSASNLQPLKYLIFESEGNDKIFPYTNWAGYLKDWDGPEEGERPAAYIVVVGDREISTNYWADPGIAMQTILLRAVEKGFNGCILGAIDKKGIRTKIELDERYDILYVVALGYPAEEVVLEKCEDDDIKYWRDNNDLHHVPKRKLEDIILN
ncbi:MULTISPECIES: nitroreductase family protein [unclassified Halanaerobium]|uniref:nitroreductase family protein n=1 Tax=unclassified Halanaerobium TaxID=2641197 RepID=UPI000DF27995|nr:MULTISPECIES: nitroreductase family protein [unclassified Halanaerobium]RCW51434.1 nitroreductase [Halanaerobium sp. MA284_MarDTE_T2]RCW89222.1 nitroreductase [Halanaerobium sp. DL-01]